MNIMVNIECDKCFETYVIGISGENAIDVCRQAGRKLTSLGVRKELVGEGWHVLKSCLCPECKTEVGEQNCMKCKHYDYKENNHRCCREISRSGGFVEYDGTIISKNDSCEHFENN